MKVVTIIKTLIISLIIVFIFGCFLYEFFHGFSNDLSLSIIGGDLEIELNGEYNELGVQAFYKDVDISEKVEIIDKINVAKVGVYDVEYVLNYKKLSKKVTRKVYVVDNEVPILKLNGDSILYFYLNDVYSEYGVTVTDNSNEDLSSKVEITNNIDNTKEGTYEVIYKVKDSSGNENTISRTVIYRKKVEPIKKQQVAVLNYHFFYDASANEKCNESLCVDVKSFEQQLKYLKENGFKTLTMEEFRSWMYGESDIPSKSVLITIDDGGIGVGKDNGNKLIPLLEKYEIHATLFLVTAWWPPTNYESSYLDIQSHTYDMHYEGVCSGVSRGAKMLCSNYEDVISDLKASINIIGSNTAFCYPFYVYNDNVLNAVKEVGFKLAFVGGNRKATRSSNKYKIPRYPVYKYTTLEQFKNMVN